MKEAAAAESARCGCHLKETMQRKDSAMAKRNTPEKPPSGREASIAGKGLPGGKLSKKNVQTLSGRVLSERAASKPKGK